jgi:phenylacetate-CoA ligase
MTIKVEREADAAGEDSDRLAETVALEIRRKILVRSQVEILPHGSLPRTGRKSRRVFDHRK